MTSAVHVHHSCAASKTEAQLTSPLDRLTHFWCILSVCHRAHLIPSAPEVDPHSFVLISHHSFPVWIIENYSPSKQDLPSFPPARFGLVHFMIVCVWLCVCLCMWSCILVVCTLQVDVAWFYRNCLTDTCNCNRGGDCECLCTSIAAYAHKCCQQGVTIRWRSPSVCREYTHRHRHMLIVCCSTPFKSVIGLCDMTIEYCHIMLYSLLPSVANRTLYRNIFTPHRRCVKTGGILFSGFPSVHL